MRTFSLFRFALVWLAAAVVGIAAEESGAKNSGHPLVWEKMEQTYNARAGDEVAEFVFKVHNQSDQKVQIDGLEPSCGCTVPEMPAAPWLLMPGEKGQFRATIDFKGKEGTVSKTIEVVSKSGNQSLRVTVIIPDTEETRRMRNQRMAAVDRQAVFKGACVACHVSPGVGKQGAELFAASCGICHTAEHRATMVPDLAVAKQPRDEAFWRKWITEGRVGSLMPAFAEANGGPLTAAQVDSLVAYVSKQFPAQPAAAK